MSVDHESSKKQSELILAARNNQPDIVKGLLDVGFPINNGDQNDRTALWHAAEKNNSTIIQLLIHHGADLNQQDINGFSPLLAAAKQGHLKMVDAL